MISFNLSESIFINKKYQNGGKENNVIGKCDVGSGVLWGTVVAGSLKGLSSGKTE
jgi:hypothetical protein